MGTLYIIGNGFDLWHELPTSYDDFYEFAKDELDELNWYFNESDLREKPWCDFERSLGTFNWQSFYDAHDNTDVTAENFRPSEVYALEDDLTEQAENLVEMTRDRFREWVDEIDVTVASRKIKFSSGSRFINFNYTSTLQLVYGIEDDNVFHIHGRTDGLSDLIFGHGMTMEEEPELDENGDSNWTIFSDAEGAAMYPFYAFQKPVARIIEESGSYFDSLRYVTNIIVIGHSMNDIDLPYFRKVSQCIGRAFWQVVCHSEEDKIKSREQLMKCGVRESDIRISAYP